METLRPRSKTATTLPRFLGCPTNRWIAGVVLFLALAAPGYALVTYPGAAPCNTTLQACITGVASGEIIELATSSPIDENLAVGKSLTLRPAAGFTPVIGGSATLRALDLGNLGASGGAETVLIEGLHFTNARIDGFIYQGAGHSITVRDCVFFLEIANNNTPSIEIDDRVPLTGVVEHNRITSIGQGVRLWAILPSAAGHVSYLVDTNSITTSLPAESNAGIALELRGSGTYQVGVFSNVIQGIGGCNCGGNGGITFDVVDDPQVVASITNNTVDRTQSANGMNLLVRDSGANVTFNIFNNIVSHSAYAGISLGNLSGATIALNADQNDSFANGSPDDFLGLPAGTVLNVDPQYRNAAGGDLRLMSSSPLVDVGIDAPTGGDSSLDAAGGPRIVGAHVDIGAYEQVPLPAPALGAVGLVVFGLALLIAAVVLLRRTVAAG